MLPVGESALQVGTWHRPVGDWMRESTLAAGLLHQLALLKLMRWRRNPNLLDRGEPQDQRREDPDHDCAPEGCLVPLAGRLSRRFQIRYHDTMALYGGC